MTDNIIRLQVQAQNYPWGKVGKDSIISEFGAEAVGSAWSFGENTPYAELWLSSTHPNAPAKIFPSPQPSTSSTSTIQSTLQSLSPSYFGKTLSSYLGEHPEALGKAGEKFRDPVEGKGGERFLPFLFKVLTCKQALPLQIHPDKDLAAKLHKENPEQFVDFNHKPEIAVALTPFLGYAGFQPLCTIKSSLTHIPELRELLSGFTSYQNFVGAEKPTAGELKELVRDVLKLNPKSGGGVVQKVKGIVGLGGDGKEDGERVDAAIEGLLKRFEKEGVKALEGVEMSEGEKGKVLRGLGKLQEYYRGDPASVVAAFTMNLIELQPGEGIYVGADGAHAWLDGQIIELMATSDNVLNLGFVPPEEKDSVDLFIDAVTCEPRPGDSYKLEKERWNLSDGAGASVFKVPAEEFSLYHIDGNSSTPTTIKPLNGPTVIIITSTSSSGSANIYEGSDNTAKAMEVKKGQVYFVAAGTGLKVGEGVEVWGAFWDDQERGQTETKSPTAQAESSTSAAKAASASASTIPAASPKHEEYQYLDLIRHIIENGQHRPDRTGTGTVAMFAPPALRFSLANNALPLLTTKRVFMRGVLEELLWFVAGHTDGKILSDKGVNIWEGNGSREYLDRIGLNHRRVGDLGPVYGFQWRHFGAKYKTCEDDYAGQGVDQLQQVIDKIKNNPTDRRIIMSAWNPADLSQMALPPCHMFCQFYVTLPEAEGQKAKLSCLMYQRSCDLGLGVPFNIASYSLLTHMIALVTDTEPHEFILQMGDAHVYKDHVEPLKIQLEREPRPFPTLQWKRTKEEIGDIDGFKAEDFEVVGYKPMGKIEMKMSA